MLRILLVTPLLVIVSCAHEAPTPPIVLPPAAASNGGVMANPDVVHADGTFAATDGLMLYEQSWRPKGEARAVLVIMHGLKDYSGHYAWVAEALAPKGFATYAFDLRGHGKSAGDRVRINSFEEYLNDLDQFVKRVREKEPKKPLFVFGHSMGGAIVTLYALTRKPEIQGIVLSGPALKPGSDVSGFLIGVTKLLGSIAPGLGVMSLENKSFSRDPAVVAGMDSDPLIYNKAAAARTAAELLRAMEKIQSQMEDMTLPFLVMHGTDDKLTNPEGSKDLQQRARSADKTLKLYGGYYHDLLHEPDKQVVFGDMATWLEAHVAAH